MAGKKERRSERDYLAGESAYYVDENTILRVEVLKNCCPRGLGIVDYDLRILEVVELKNPNSFARVPEKGLEFKATKISNFVVGENWRIVETLEETKERESKEN